MGKRIGLSDEKLLALPAYQQSDVFDAKEKATLRYADEVTQEATLGHAPNLEALKAHYQEDEIVELTLAICMANFTNRFNLALQTEPDIS